MSVSYTTNARLTKQAVGDRGWATALNSNSDTLEALTPVTALLVQPTGIPNTTLGITVAAGVFLDAARVLTSYAGGSITLAASSTVYVWLTDAGVLSSGTAWPTATNYVPLAVVVTGASTITSVTDARVPFFSSGQLQASANQAAITNSTGGTIGTTLAACTATNSSDQSGTINSNFASLWNQLNAIRTALIADGMIKGSA
jgi:hypothetical protein